jgi:hypothetical protein
MVCLCLEVSLHIEKVVGVLDLGVVSSLDVPLVMDNTWGSNRSFRSQRSYGPWSLLVVRAVLQGDVWVFHLGGIGWILLTPRLRKW